ncbi:MATE family efflux transporter [Candidatus Pseudothioglobus singularis]|jgi:MATE family multidrug resistance protein|nr:MATE family efflux transporter [Candidatus Pseudothioglobus singularis]MBT8009389.1 MATE family efflux transporter [Gammaproteobacteria bacterium]MDA8755535.1 MATE family efflux transporter [Candidatus Pseudothioglobus singularis]MDA8813761.1 MATE family efflux transporter [Candidatus Pseudothioglobus singularis]MDB4846870.1 MATE family efflux transporter [Candidatus Pseudothioglobus singularis]
MNPSSTKLTHKRVLGVAIPIVLANATIPILGAVDTGVVGQMGLAVPIGAVGIGAIIISAIYWLFGFLRMGTTGLTAQAIGSNDHSETSALLVRGILIGLGAGLVLIMTQIPLFSAALGIAPASFEVESLAQEYLKIRVYSAPAAIAIFGITGWLIANERTRAVLVLMLLINSINIVLDFVFVLRLGWGVEGVAYATLIAEWSGLFFGLWLARKGFKNGYWKNWSQIFDRARLTKMAKVNSDILIRSVLLEIAFVSFLFLGSSFDDATLAANQVLIQFLNITAYAMDGFAFAAEALVGKALGAKNRLIFRRSAVMTSQWGFGSVVVMALAFYVFGNTIINVMTTAEDVRAVSYEYLPWMVLAPLVGAAAWMLDGIFIGATRTADMRNMMFISFCVYLIALALLLPKYGNHGLWASLIIFSIARGVTLGYKYPKLEASVED